MILPEERRDLALELRATEAQGKTTLVGMAVPYGVLSADLGGFRERFTKDALHRTVSEKLDVRAYVAHDPAHPIARVSTGTLRLDYSRDDGLHCEIDPPQTSAARDLVELVQRGDIGGLSIAFRVMKGGESWDHSVAPPIRTIHDCRLVHLSPVSEPAYPTTNVEVALRSLEESRAMSTTPPAIERKIQPSDPMPVESTPPPEPRSGAGVIVTRTMTHDEDEARILVPAGQSVRFALEARGALRVLPNGAYVGLGDCVRALVFGGRHRGVREEARASLAEGADATGGITVPDVTSTSVIDRLRNAAVIFRAGATTMPLTSDTTKIPRVTTDPTPAARNEAAAIAESDPVLEGVTVVPRSIAVYFKASNELLEDSTSIDGVITTVLTESMARLVDYYALYGTGVAPIPRGVAATSGVGNVSMGAAGAALTSWDKPLAAIEAMMGANARFPTAAIMNSRTFLNGIARMKETSTLAPLARPEVLRDLPILVTNAIPNTETDDGSAAASRIFFGDWPELIVAIRTDLRIAVARELFILNQQTAFVATMRVDFVLRHPASFSMLTAIEATP